MVRMRGRRSFRGDDGVGDDGVGDAFVMVVDVGTRIVVYLGENMVENMGDTKPNQGNLCG